MPESPTSQPIEAPIELSVADRTAYLAKVMGEIDGEVRKRRASGDLPASIERELDELFLEFSPVGLQGKAQLRENLALVDGAAYIDIGVPVASQKKVGVYLKRLIRKSMNWYIGFIVHQIVKSAWAVSRMLHVLVDHLETIESTVESLKVPELPTTAIPVVDTGVQWWAPHAIAALSATKGRVLHAECGNGTLVAKLLENNIDAYGVDPSEELIESAIDRGLDVRAESALHHLDVVASEALSGVVLNGSVQWLHPNDRDRLLHLVATRLGIDGVLVLQSATPEAWQRTTVQLVADLAPGHPLHAETWTHVLATYGLTVTAVHSGGDDQRLEKVEDSNPGASVINAAIDVVNSRLLGPGEYVLTAVRDR